MGFLRMGSTGFAAQAAGRNDGAALRQILLQGLLLALGLAMLLGTVGIPLSHLALEWMQPSPELNQTDPRLLPHPPVRPARRAGQLMPWSAGSSAPRTPARRWRFC